jgi:nucleoside-diphosphate-sugar epimerase
MSIGKTLIIPSSSLHTGAQVAPHLKRFKLGSFMTVPVILQELVELEDPEIIEVLRNLDFVACAGGTLKESVGDRLASFGVKILNSYGNTEAGPLSVLYAPAADHDWHWFTLRNDMGIAVTQEDGTSGLRSNQRFRLEVTPPGWTRTFEMQDSFAMNPNDATKRQFRPLERTDDVIVLKNGEKVLPYNLESILAEHEDVRGAVVFGNGQSQLGVLVEPRQRLDSFESLSRFKESLLHSLSEAGDLIDAHARIVFPEAIVVLGNKQNLPRSDKGALLRKASCETYHREIETTYELLDSVVLETDISILKGDIEENLQQLIKSRILRAGQSQELTPTTDLFELGIDSLQAMQLRRILFSSLVAESGDRDAVSEMMPRSFIYMNPTISQMTQRLTGKLDLQIATSRDEAVRQLVEAYTVKSDDQQSNNAEGAVILLTGASGGLGSHILAHLAASDSVKRIICFNRPSMLSPDPYIRQYSCSRDKGADVPEDLRNKIEVLDTNLALPHFGLAETVYNHLVATVTHIVHNAWPVDFNRQLSSFRPQFQALSNLIRFSLAAKERRQSRGDDALVHLLFVSSISVVGAHTHDGASHGPFVVPELPASSAEHTLTLGYAEAKLVCETMLHNATQAGIVNGVINRMGQIAGAMSNGYWNTSEHIPTMLQTSAQIGALPQIEGVSIPAAIVR